MKLKKVWDKAKRMHTRQCDKCGSADTMLVCMECMRKEKEKVFKWEERFQRQLNK